MQSLPPKASGPGCVPGPNTRRPGSLAEVVDHYIGDHRECAQRERRYYAIQRSVAAAARAAALCTLPGGKRHPHQHRIPASVLQRAVAALSAGDWSADTFHDLYLQVRSIIGPIRGVGELMLYDVATRIGAKLELEPELIYLHAGTREGARALGLRGATIAKSELPEVFGRLTPGEIEDCLCIYKADLHRLASGTRP
jgi:hypothetical protein